MVAILYHILSVGGKKKKSTSFEPDSNQRPMDYYTPLQSTALPTELSKEISTAAEISVFNQCAYPFSLQVVQGL